MGITGKRTPKGKRLYSCDCPGCGRQDAPWGRSWIWYGSYRDLEDGEAIKTFCSADCVEAFRAWQVLNGAAPLPALTT